jgi:site-specific recombinase
MTRSLSFSSWLGRRDTPAERARLDTLLEFAPAQESHELRVLWFVDLIGWLRPRAGENVDTKLRYFEHVLGRAPAARTRVSQALSRLVAGCDIRLWLAYGGTPRDFHFLGAFSRWLTSRFLPRACATKDGVEILALAFRLDDGALIAKLAHAPMFRALIDPDLVPTLARALSDALTDLAHQVVSQAHAPNIRSLTSQERSPFGGLYDAVQALDAAPQDAARAQALLGRIAQCQTLVASHRMALAERGADLNTTFQLTRLRRQLARLASLTALRHRPGLEIGSALEKLCGESLREELGARLVWSSADLVVQNIVDTTAAVGRTYLEVVQTSTFSAFRAGALGGLLMAVATIVKLLLHELALPKLYEGLAFALNYVTVFSVAYLVHATIATKLPAHTAAALARVLQHGNSLRTRLSAFLLTWRAMVRLQLAGLLGNVVVAAPAAALLAYGFRAAFGRALLTHEAAEHALSAQSLLGPSLFYAALTGLLLWVSSLFGALIDNWARFNGLRERLATRIVSLRRRAPERARAHADAFTDKLGGLAANASLGMLLAGVPTLFALAELPVEIRHVTVSASSVAVAVVDGAHEPGPVALAIAGVLCIGAVNVLVAFSLALWLALRATRGLEGDRNSRALWNLGLRRWLRRRADTRAHHRPNH